MKYCATMFFAAAALCVGLPLTGVATAQAPASAQAAVDGLIAADRNFSAAGSDLGLVPSLLAMFDDDVILPLPTGTFARGKQAADNALRGTPANLAAKATWSPVRGGISADGLHGFTYGFMTMREEGKADRRAKYLAYWVKRPAGWRVIAYKRGFSPSGPVSTALRPPAIPTRIVGPATDAATVATHKASLTAAEKAFSDRAQIVGLGPTFTEFGAPDAMNMGRNPDFVFGNVAIGGSLGPEKTSPVHWAADYEALVASSGDLGINFGFIRPHKAPPAGQPPASAFFTIWRRAAPDQPWRYVAE